MLTVETALPDLLRRLDEAGLEHLFVTFTYAYDAAFRDVLQMHREKGRGGGTWRFSSTDGWEAGVEADPSFQLARRRVPRTFSAERSDVWADRRPGRWSAGRPLTSSDGEGGRSARASTSSGPC